MSIIKARKKILPYGKPLIMGIVNVTPDSFSGDGVVDSQAAIDHALKQLKEGADIVDIGGESSRPSAEPISAEEEQKRIMPVVEYVTKNTDAIISVDTYHPETAEVVLAAGAHIINDIYGLRDDKMASVIAKYQAGVIIMHMLGTPQTMQDEPHYDDIVGGISQFFQERIEKARQAGIADQQMMVDPGIGFGKTFEHNLTLIKSLSIFHKPFGSDGFNYPIVIGVSRKGFIGKLTGKGNRQERVFGTAGAVAISIANAANIVRVHDVAAMKDVVAVAEALTDNAVRSSS